MANITLSMKEDLIKSGREYARRHHTTLNALIRVLLERTIRRQSSGWMDECFHLMDKAGASSRGKKWKREDLYDV